MGEFNKTKRYKLGVRPWCRACDRTYNRKWALRRKDPRVTNARRRRLTTRYGLTVDEYFALYHRQAGLCALCHRQLPALPPVDHSHRTGAVRGLLCVRCNTGLGYLEDQTYFVLAREYLLRTEGTDLFERAGQSARDNEQQILPTSGALAPKAGSRLSWEVGDTETVSDGCEVSGRAHDSLLAEGVVVGAAPAGSAGSL